VPRERARLKTCANALQLTCGTRARRRSHRARGHAQAGPGASGAAACSAARYQSITNVSTILDESSMQKATANIGASASQPPRYLTLTL
jgi:hypothetical protein